MKMGYNKGKNNPMYGVHRFGKNAPGWKGGKTANISGQEGRVFIYKPNHPNANRKGYVMQSHVIMENILGRYLTLKEVVHHKNGKKDDDRPENLELFASRGKHTSFHNHQRKEE